MPETVFTIPINEAFDQMEGCPLCRLRDRLEEQTLDYTLGAAMMEPQVRVEMNRVGFCHSHLKTLSSRKNRLALGLILESHLDELHTVLEAPSAGTKRGLFSRKAEGGDAAEELSRFSKDCFICSRIRSTELRYCSNVGWLWESDPAFRGKLERQPFFCLSHSAMLLRVSKPALKADSYQSLYQTLTELLQQYAAALREDVTAFTVSFDHRNAEAPLSEQARSSIERSIRWLR